MDAEVLDSFVRRLRRSWALTRDLEAIASARSIDELKRLERLARARYSGDRLNELETEPAIRRGAIADPPAA